MNSKKQKILIIGASGLIGGYLSRLFKGDNFDVVLADFEGDGTAVKKLDIRDESAVKNILDEFAPEAVIVPAAIPNVELCETNPVDTRPTNVIGMKNIIRHLPPEALLVYFSSDYIFDGVNGPYVEDDVPNPLSEYGREKLEVEKEIKKTVKDYLILRTAVVFGWEPKGKNFVMQVLRRAKAKEMVTAPFDQVSNATYAGDIAEAIRELIKQDKRGVFHVAGNGVLNRLDFAKMIATVFGLDKNYIKGISTVELKQKAKRPLLGGLKINKLEGCGIRMSSAEEGLKKMRQNPISDLI